MGEGQDAGFGAAMGGLSPGLGALRRERGAAQVSVDGHETGAGEEVRSSRVFLGTETAAVKIGGSEWADKSPVYTVALEPGA